ncbi:hypothetical protein CYY_008172 [Polysphondylium violaceum]|uniref:MORN repeat-containing protein n=1 Tax=Polysphondylium violaceum TaxID=133409 RepID=A0A8J4PPN3_9MYCE|nr:hypothetical protein CYY_008172 [Polysphondylium violaceum]
MSTCIRYLTKALKGHRSLSASAGVRRNTLYTAPTTTTIVGSLTHKSNNVFYNRIDNTKDSRLSFPTTYRLYTTITAETTTKPTTKSFHTLINLQEANDLTVADIETLLNEIPVPAIEFENLIKQHQLEKSNQKEGEKRTYISELEKLRFPNQDYGDDGTGEKTINVQGQATKVQMIDNSGLKATIQSKNGSSYDGQANRDGTPNGFGHLEMKNGDFYIGFFKDGKMSGTGKYEYANGDSFDGEWLDNVRHGHGKSSEMEGKLVYEGMWEHGKRHGPGVFTLPNDAYIKGIWEHDELIFGQEINEDQAEYLGEYKDNQWHGKGKLMVKQSTLYCGEFKNGSPNGQGSWTSANQIVENDNWVDGVANGMGRFVSKGLEVQGNWTNNNINYGVIKRDQHGVYIGEFNKFIPNGSGKEYFVDGSFYKGSYVDGKRSGQGYFQWSDGTSYRGEWVRDYRVGVGKLITKSGDVFQGEFKETLDPQQGLKLCGKGIINKADGSVYSGEWMDGVPEGWGTFTSKDKLTTTQGIWSKGKLINTA